MHTTTKPSTSPLSAWIDPHPKLDGVALIDHLFNKLDGLYPHRWRSAFANQHAIANWRQAWAEGFAEEGITMAEIKRGIAECRRLFDWPPSFAEFVKACRPALDYERAYEEAVEQMRRRDAGEDSWSTPAVYWAATKLGVDLLAHPYQSIKGRWHAALDEAIEGIRTGKLPAAVPKRREALPAPGQCSVPPEVAKQRLAGIRDMLARKMTMQ
jgi:hypothetical protein